VLKRSVGIFVMAMFVSFEVDAWCGNGR
jgi:hypothetical protein